MVFPISFSPGFPLNRSILASASGEGLAKLRGAQLGTEEPGCKRSPCDFYDINLHRYKDPEIS
jgi:hypothetical protein